MRTGPTFKQYLIAALVAGAAAGVLSGLPIVGGLNCLCCAWLILGGILAGFILKQSLRDGITPSEGASVGAFAGVIAGVLGWFLGSIIFRQFGLAQMEQQLSDMPAEQREIVERSLEIFAGPIGALLITGLFTLFAMVGGLIAAAIWKPQPPAERYEAPPPPPPPPPPAAPSPPTPPGPPQSPPSAPGA